MPGKVQQKREALRNRLIEIAERRIVDGGLASVRARDIAREAGCAVGTIYTVFGDLNDLFMAVNGQTFRRMGAFVAGELHARAPADPMERLVVIGKAYLAFAAQNHNAWRALFDIEMSMSQDVPPWYMAELGRLFALITAPLAELRPDRPEAERELLARALFSSVHGIVLLGLEKRISAVPAPELETVIEAVVRKIASD